VDIKAAVNYLEGLWTPEQGAFREAYGLNHYWQNDNYIASIVMSKYDPAKVQIQRSGILSGYTDIRWCLLTGDTIHFKQTPLILPDWMRYADLVVLQFLYLCSAGLQGQDGPPGAPTFYTRETLMGILGKMYGLEYPGYITDIASPFEAYTMYKLCIYALCALKFNYESLAEELINTVTQFQIQSGPQAGGIKTEYVPPDLQSKYPGLLGLANCETTSLCIIAQEALNSYKLKNGLMTGFGLAAAGAGAISLAVKWRSQR
jgi:hypothetical protein